jgi:hypothetical protein
LVQADLVEHLDAASDELGCQPPGERDVPFDERGDAAAPERREHGPDLGAARTLGGLRGEQHGLTRLP